MNRFAIIVGVCSFFLWTLVTAQNLGELECPEIGEVSYGHEEECDRYYLCINGTWTFEQCPNGLLHSGTHGAVYGHCGFPWNVNCYKKKIPGPISSPGCPYQFGFFPAGAGPCATFYSNCAWGIPEKKQCEPFGLVYDDRIKGCNWPDKVGCESESILGFKCPLDDTKNRFYPYSRYYYTEHAIITCVDGQPRLINCPAGQYADGNSLTCLSYDKDDKNSS